MKKIIFVLTITLGMMGCESNEPEFPDFDYTAGYFPYQYPVRTLVLGDYIYDNTNDNNHKFLISAAMGGVYANTQERVFEIEMASSLCDNALFGSTKDTIRLLPPAYYTLSSPNTLVIPAGEVNGNIEVQLTDAFFEDTLATQLGYVIPIRIVNTTNLDSILRGKSGFDNPDPRISAMWDVAPKDFTMFAVNYINPYHGMYLHRGVNEVKDASNAILESVVYHTKYVEENAVSKLKTTGKNQVVLETNSRSTLYPGVLKMNLTFDESGNCTITGEEGSDFPVTGTGQFSNDADEWGGKKRDAIHIKYQFTSGTDTFSATDTLVIRDRAIKMQVYTPVVY